MLFRSEAISIEESLQFAEEYGETKDIQLKYFTVTFYKKGTCHITFNNEELLSKFNLYGSQKKGWLPQNFGKSAYKDMTNEEKNVVDSFCGKEKYNSILENKDYYLGNVSNNLLTMGDEKIA